MMKKSVFFVKNEIANMFINYGLFAGGNLRKNVFRAYSVPFCCSCILYREFLCINLQKAADFAQIKRKSPFAGTLSFSGIYMYTGSAGIKSFFAVQFIPGLLQMPLTCFS